MKKKDSFVRTKIDLLMSKARMRPEQEGIPYDSNYNFVLDRIDDYDHDILEDLYWTLQPYQLSLLHVGRQYQDKTTALIIDDDQYIAQEYGSMLLSYNIVVSYAFTVDDALRVLRSYGNRFEIVIVDIRMPFGDYYTYWDTCGGQHSGLELAREIQTYAPQAKIVALTNSSDPSVVAWFDAQEDAFYCRKADYSSKYFANYIKSVIMRDSSGLKSFIIHGHDKLAALELKNYLQNSLGFPQPIILSEQKSKGMTIIEKLEYYISQVDLVFALFTPDDFIAQTNKSNARQNVVFEFGIVVGMLGRKSGRIFYLYKQGVEIPTDLSGMIYIDITNGITAAGEEIRNELDEFLH